MRPTHIIIHHSATPDGAALDRTAIKQFHTSWRSNGRVIGETEALVLRAEGVPVTAPWLDIGYHYLIERVGSEIVVVAGRMPDVAGAHCLGMNDRSLGVCLIGNFDLAPPSREALFLAERLVISLCRVHGIPHANVRAHRDFAATNCPGRQFDLDYFRHRLKE